MICTEIYHNYEIFRHTRSEFHGKGLNCVDNSLVICIAESWTGSAIDCWSRPCPISQSSIQHHDMHWQLLPVLFELSCSIQTGVNFSTQTGVKYGLMFERRLNWLVSQPLNRLVSQPTRVWTLKIDSQPRLKIEWTGIPTEFKDWMDWYPNLLTFRNLFRQNSAVFRII
jgi:hypothetical protein